MPIQITQLVEIFVFIAVGAACATPLLLLNIKVAPRLGMIDWPKARGLAEEQIPIVGHSMVLLSMLTFGLLSTIYNISPWFITTALVIAAMGHFDDRRPLSALDKIFFQIVCVGTVVYMDPQINEAMTQRYGNWGTFWGAFFIVGLVNAINFIDGIDGLAGIVIIVGASGFLSFSLGTQEYYPYFVYSSMLIGMMIPFLYFNVLKRKGFLGNVGSYFFAYVLAMMHLSIPLSSANALSRVSISGLCFLIPIADSIMVVASRLGSFRSPLKADKGHLHHRLIQTSIALRYILLNFSLISGAGLVIAFLVSRNLGVRNSLLPIFLCLSHIGISGIFIVMVEKASKRRIQYYFQKLDSGDPIYFLKYELRHLDDRPFTSVMLRRLEARISAEIRVTDLCFAEKPNLLFVTLRTLGEPLKGISARLDTIFQTERVQTRLVVDQGEFVKVSYQNPAKAPTLKKA